MPHEIELDMDEQERFVARAIAGQFFFGYAVEIVFPDGGHLSSFLEAFAYERTYPERAGIPHFLCGDWHQANVSSDTTHV